MTNQPIPRDTLPKLYCAIHATEYTKNDLSLKHDFFIGSAIFLAEIKPIHQSAVTHHQYMHPHIKLLAISIKNWESLAE